MGSIAGIIHPSAYHMSELLESMSDALFSAGAKKSLHGFHFKNLEVGAWDTKVASNEKKTVWAVLDGSFYNTIEVKKILREDFSLTPETDAELLVAAYEAWKEKCIEKLNGPFALALFDEEKEILLLARDRIGQKTLYWSSQGDYWLFSSQIKGLLATGLVPQNPALDSLAAYFYFGFIPQDLTAIQGINKLLPGHYIKIDLKRQMMIRQYWSLSAQIAKKNPMTESEAYDTFGHLLEDSIRATLPEKSHFTSELSNELGSICLNWFMSHLVKKEKFETITPIFETPLSDQELSTTRAFSGQFGIACAEKRISVEEMFRDIVQIVWQLDEPIADPGVFQTWHLGQISAQTGSRVFSAIGWEEMLAGHPRYFINKKNLPTHPSFAYQIAHLYPMLRSHIVQPLLSTINPHFKLRMMRNIDINRELMTYLLYIALFKGKNRKKATPRLYPYFDHDAFTQRFHRLNMITGTVEPSLYFDIKTELPDRLLFQHERLFASQGIELVAPFLHTPLVTFFAQVPESIKFDDSIPAVMLQKLMHKLYRGCPMYEEPKTTYLHFWSKDKAFRRFFHILENGRLAEEGIISPKWVRKKLVESEMTPDNFIQLWSILILEIWFRLYINRPIGTQDYNVTLEELLT